jgi:exodeoxyribonuclease V alpha subunit
MDFLRCVVERITYTNEENGYAVLRVRVKGYDDLVTVVGNMGAVNAGAVLSLKGEWKMDGKYGRQFAVREYEETLPATVYGIEKYLGSGLIKGVGPKFAGRIVKTFGADTLTVIEETPDKLIDVPGIGRKRVGMIKKAWQDQKEIKNIMLFLQDHGVGTAFAFKIFKAFGEGSIPIVKENPYKLTDIWGIGFKTADTVAVKMGFDKESFYRCRSGLLYVLNECSNDGHCFMPREELTRKAAEMLEIEDSKLLMTIDHMTTEKDLILEAPDSLYLPPLYYSESGTAKRVRALLDGQSALSGADRIIGRVEKSSGIQYDEVQKDAIRTAAASKVMILTGGPGTGKTTTVKGIIAVFREAGMEILLAAPTGRAAKRLSETTGMEAKTIHRLLEAKPPEGYQRNEENKLEGDVLIIDESSMIDIVLMYSLLRAVPDSMTVIFVGDVDQLPSVGAGNVLRDMISSGAVPVVKLTRIFRQAMGSHIVMNAHRINKGQFPNLKTGKESDFFFVEQPDNAEVPQTVVELCTKRLPGFFKVNPTDIQVLCPMQRGESGARNLNVLLQNAVNRSASMLTRGGVEYRLGSKVMQIRNNYDKECWNGDIGIIADVDEENRSLSVSFDGDAPISYDVTELDELVLAYATTIHKAQGSEYDVVVIPLTMQHYMMLQRNLLYTGITRAKRAVVLAGTAKAIGMAVRNDSVTKRNTGLAARLREGLM